MAKTPMERFTAWLSVAERNAVRRMAREYGTSENYVVRMAVRQLLDMPVPSHPPQNTADRAESV